MSVHVSPTLGGALVSNAKGRPAAPMVPMWRVGRAPLPTPPLPVLVSPVPPLAPANAWATTLLESDKRLPDPIPAASRDRSVTRFVTLVAGLTKLNVSDIRGPCRRADLVKARSVAMWLAKRFAKRSFPEIGRAIGGRDHTTILHACRKIDVALVALGAPDEDTPEVWAKWLLRSDWPPFRRDRNRLNEGRSL